MTAGIAVAALFMLGMGLCALVRPAFVVTFVGLVPSTADARNEVRAVYGGFGVAMAALLVFTSGDATLRPVCCSRWRLRCSAWRQVASSA